MKLGLIIICGLIWFAISVTLSLIDLIFNADSKVTAAFISGTFIFIAGLIATLYTQHQIKKREIEEAHRAKKVVLYNEFIEIVQTVIASGVENGPIQKIQTDELSKFLAKFRSGIMLWSSPGVINAYVKFDNVIKSHGGPKLLFPSIDNMYREMRKDIGLSNHNLPKNQLVKIYLTDPEVLD